MHVQSCMCFFSPRAGKANGLHRAAALAQAHKRMGDRPIARGADAGPVLARVSAAREKVVRGIQGVLPPALRVVDTSCGPSSEGGAVSRNSPGVWGRPGRASWHRPQDRPRIWTAVGRESLHSLRAGGTSYSQLKYRLYPVPEVNSLSRSSRSIGGRSLRSVTHVLLVSRHNVDVAAQRFPLP